MKKIAIYLILITSLWSLDIVKAVELGLAKKTQFMDTKQKLENTNQADIKLDIRLAYLKFLEARENINITNGAIKKLEKFKNSKTQKELLRTKKQELEESLLDIKSILESIVGEKIENINSVENINLAQLKNTSLEELIDKSVENSEEISSLEQELNEYDAKKLDSSWNVDVSGDVTYSYETSKRKHNQRYKSNEVELGLSIVLSKKSGAYENDSTIEIAQKRDDLQKQKINLQNDTKKARDEYLRSLKQYKLTKIEIKKYDIKNLKDEKETQEAYNSYMKNIEALYDVYRQYARLLYVIEKN